MHSTVNHAAGQLYLFCGKNKDHIKFNIIYNMAKLLASSYLGTTILGAQTPKKKKSHRHILLFLLQDSFSQIHWDDNLVYINQTGSDGFNSGGRLPARDSMSSFLLPGEGFLYNISEPAHKGSRHICFQRI